MAGCDRTCNAQSASQIAKRVFWEPSGWFAQCGIRAATRRNSPRQAMNDVSFTIDRTTPGTLVGKVAAELRGRIADGTLRPGDSLPSRDVLANELGVSEFVVRRAFAELAAERLIVGRPRVGHIVLDAVSVRRERVVLDVSTENFGTFASRVSTAECFRGLRKHDCRVIPVTLGVDSRGTAYLAPLVEAMKTAPDFVFIRTCGSRQSLVCRTVADAGVPHATITLGTAPRTPGRCCGTIRLEKDVAIGEMVDDCLKSQVRSVMQVDFGKDTYVDATSVFRDRHIYVERLSIPLMRCRDLDDVVEMSRIVTEKHIDSGVTPDMIFVADDYLSLGVVSALRRRRIEPPRDVRLVVYSNRGSGLFVGDEYARIELDPFADGREIARCIAEFLETGVFGRYCNPLVYHRGRSFAAI